MSKKVNEKKVIDDSEKENIASEENVNVNEPDQSKENHENNHSNQPEGNAEEAVNSEKQQEIPSGEEDASFEKGEVRKTFDTVKEELEKVAGEGWTLLKKAFGKVKEISSDATELTKLKLEHKKLLDKKEDILLDMGISLWESYQKGEKIEEIKFEEQFKQLEELEKQIDDLKKKIGEIKILQ